ncbi:MAG: arginine--tRNA ligase [Spirochaetes bacterium]|nr:arginine--tRNA ligase [Spirochaetota bacterium]
MVVFKEQLKQKILQILKELAQRKGLDPEGIRAEHLSVENPPKPELGDLAIPLFPFAKVFRMPPQTLSSLVGEELQQKDSLPEGIDRFSIVGPYLNIFLNRSLVTGLLFQQIRTEGDRFGSSSILSSKRIMVEFSSPNTNKPLHLGHLRNDALGESVARILRFSGATVRTVDLINDRGIHICKSMLAYQELGHGRTPEDEGLKSDHFVGKYYVLYNELAKRDPEAEDRARNMLVKWEQGDPEVRLLWEKMNRWAIEGIKRTYERTGIHFDQFYFESEVYLKGKEEVLKGLEKGIFYQEADGSIWVNLEDIGLDRKVLLRSDGTSLYVTQDIGTAISRYKDWPFDVMIYVVASEQNYHFKVLFSILERLGYEWAKNLYHLSYGMVNLPEGKMKSREGTVVDADDLLDELTEMAKEEIRTKEREGEVGDLEGTAGKIALGALHYYLLQPSPSKDIVFNPRESLSFTGNTGPYIQYTGARICSMVRKLDEVPQVKERTGKPSDLNTGEEWELVKLLFEFPAMVEQSAISYNPSLLANYLYEVSKTFSRYYHEHPILFAENPDVAASRVQLSRCVLQVLKNGMHLLNIPFLEVM